MELVALAFLAGGLYGAVRFAERRALPDTLDLGDLIREASRRVNRHRRYPTGTVKKIRP